LHPHTHDVWRFPQMVFMSWLPQARPHPLWGQQPAMSAMPRIEVCFPIGGIALGRAQRKALSIRRRIGARGAALDGPVPAKPPKMRWATYKRLRAVDAALNDQWLLSAAGDLGRLHSRVKRR